MRSYTRTAAATFAAFTILAAGQFEPLAQMRVRPLADARGTVALGLQLRKLQSVGTLMMTTAHPDDENNGMLAQVGLGHGWRTALVSATRGDGGQNEIGPELFDALAVLRTEELAAAHRFDGAEQFFTRAVDFGYSFSIEETYERWGRDEILDDFVRLIRTIRPDVVVGFIWEGRGGGQHHQASTRLTAEAFRAAADPARYPEQLKQGLRPWQAKKFYYTQAFFGRQEPPAGVRLLEANSNVYDPLMGLSYAQLGAQARSMHKCQGMAQVLPLPGSPDIRRYTLHETVLEGGPARPDASVIDGIDASLRSLTAFAGPNPPRALAESLEAIATDIGAAERALGTGGPAAAAAPLASGFAHVGALRGSLPAMSLSDEAFFEIDFRLAQKQQQFQDAIVLAQGLRLDAVADDGLVVPGQKVTVTARATAQGTEPVAVRRIRLQGMGDLAPACAEGATTEGRPHECRLESTIPSDARLTTPYFRRLKGADRYEFDEDLPFGPPFRPTPFRATFDVTAAGVELSVDVPVQYRYEGSGFSGEKRMDLHVVPLMAVRATPEIVIVPLGGPAPPASTRRTSGAGAQASSGADPGGREMRVSVTNHVKGPARGDARLEVPGGWTVTPASTPISFSREDEEVTVRFRIVAGARQPGDFTIAAKVAVDGVVYDQGYEIVEYPHTTRRHVVEPARALVKVLDVQVAPDLTIGYVMGAGDQVPPALSQLGATVEMLTADDLAWGDLSKYDVIVTGVRVYERRFDLRANNHRLLTYAERGGTVVVQYNKFEFNDAQFGPFPVKVSSTRVTDERAPITALVPDHPVFSFPNRIDASAWQGWVQERGLYFLGERDPRYVDLVEATETFEFNAGPKRGALVEARVGDGRWIYVGLNLWRQLPAGTEGAYRLMANLVSLPRAAGSPNRRSAR